jgi:hypothetical protein
VASSAEERSLPLAGAVGMSGELGMGCELTALLRKVNNDRKAAAGRNVARGWSRYIRCAPAGA